LRDLHRQVGLTSVFVTHDQEEALELADRVVVMNHGRIEQIGTPDAIYLAPATPFVSHFVGETNLMPGALFGRGDGDLHVRPHEIAIVASDDGQPHAQVQIANRFRKGPLWRIEGRLVDSGSLIEIDCDPGQAVPAPGDTILIRPAFARTFPAAPDFPAALNPQGEYA
jgi:sulfate transport system ATP-binding protein